MYPRRSGRRRRRNGLIWAAIPADKETGGNTTKRTSNRRERPTRATAEPPHRNPTPRRNMRHNWLISDTRARAVLRSARQLPRAVPTTTKFSTSGTGLVTRGATPPWDGVDGTRCPQSVVGDPPLRQTLWLKRGVSEFATRRGERQSPRQPPRTYKSLVPRRQANQAHQRAPPPPNRPCCGRCTRRRRPRKVVTRTPGTTPRLRQPWPDTVRLTAPKRAKDGRPYPPSMGLFKGNPKWR